MLHQSLIVTDEKAQNYVDAFRPFVLYIQQDGKCTINLTLGSVCDTIVTVEFDKYYIFECISVALDIQHAKRMRRIIVSFVACVDLPSFSTLSHT